MAKAEGEKQGIIKRIFAKPDMNTEVDIHAPGVEVVKSLCYFCHANCGVLAYVKDGDVIKIEGDPNYSNQGGLCCRGTSALLHVNHPARINHVLKRVGEKGEGKWEQIDYDQAIKEVAEKLNQIKAESGAEAVASPGGTTRTDDWARRRFLNQFGTPNGFHNALLCWIPTVMAETCVAGWSPFETDLGAAKSLILWGMNPGASSLPSMHSYWDLIQGGMKTIVVDPRYSETAAKADLWLPLRPGSDAALALAMLNWIIKRRMYNADFVATYCADFDKLKEHVAQYTPDWASKITWLPASKIKQAATMYAQNTPGCIQWGCTWDQLGRSSTTASHALALIRAICGNLDVPGGDGIPGPAIEFMTDEELELNHLLPQEQRDKQIGSNKFKLASWPGYKLISDNAMRKWGKTLPSEWFCEAHGPSVFKAVLTGDPYPIRALINCATNPMMSYGDSKMVLAAIKKVEFLVVVDYWMTPTALFADYVFPAAGALERPIICTHYGATDSFQGGRRAIQPKYDRHTDMTFWRKLGLACGQDPANWPWETEEEVYFEIIKGVNLPVSNWNEFVDKVRTYYPPLHQNKFIKNGGFWTPSGKIECDSTLLRELGYPGMPTYLGCSENEIDDPEVAAEYPIVLTTGGGFMPYHHSEHFNMPNTRYLYPEPYFSINPELAEKLHIAQGDWCWLETRRGRIKMRADVDQVVDPRVVFAPRGWWFPERDGSADLDNPFGCLESNVNVLTSVDDEHCDPMGGSWANRGLMCKVYKCTELDNKQTKEDLMFSIPGSASEPGIHRMPSEVIKAREDVPFEKPECPFEVPEGYHWTWQDNGIYQNDTFFKLEDGWLIDPKTKKYIDPNSGYFYNDAEGCLQDENGQLYSMEYEPIYKVGNVRAYPGPNAPYELPETAVWDAKQGVAYCFGKLYDPESGWCIDENGMYWDAYTGFAYLADEGTLCHWNTGYRFDLNSREPLDPEGWNYWLSTAAPEFDVPEGLEWSPITGKATYPGCAAEYDPESGWLIGYDGSYYDVWSGLMYDGDTADFVDVASGFHFDYSTREPLDPEGWAAYLAGAGVAAAAAAEAAPAAEVVEEAPVAVAAPTTAFVCQAAGMGYYNQKPMGEGKRIYPLPFENGHTAVMPADFDAVAVEVEMPAAPETGYCASQAAQPAGMCYYNQKACGEGKRLYPLPFVNGHTAPVPADFDAAAVEVAAPAAEAACGCGCGCADGKLVSEFSMGSDEATVLRTVCYNRDMIEAYGTIYNNETVEE